MLVKVIKRAFYDNRLIEEGERIEFEGDKIPSWAVPLEEVKTPVKKEAEKKEGKQKQLKVAELPEEEQAELIEKAKSLGLKGNFVTFGVDTLKAKITEAEGK